MAFKFIVLALCLAAANAGLAPAVPLAYAAQVADYHHEPQYSFGYGVQDALTGDNKHHQETRNGDVVQGSYSLLESDGTKRTVHYTADSINGFNAVVDKQPATVAVNSIATPVIAKYAAPVAAPVIAKYAAPLTYTSLAAPAIAKVAAPVAYTSYAAPAIAKYAAPLTYASYAPYTAYAAPAAYSTYATTKLAAPLAYTSYSAPVATKIAAPVAYTSYAAPVAYTNYAAPLAAKIATPLTYSSYVTPYAQAYTSAYYQKW